MGFMVPASLFIVSCGVLFTCSRILNVDNAGRMNLNWCTSAVRKGNTVKNHNTFDREYGNQKKASKNENDRESPIAQIQLTTAGTLLGYNDDTEGDPL